MPVTPSPLRYPGGKTALFSFTERLMKVNRLSRRTYAEPFAGGAGLALSLLFEGVARRILLNDFDPGIFSFWDAVINKTETLVKRIESTPVTMEEWYRQREIYRQTKDGDPSLDLGFATFFLNRTNRSGVIKGGVIGGYAQDGPYLLDCRFSKPDLIDKIRRVARYRTSISISREDGEAFVIGTSMRQDRPFLFIDPPYFAKGSGLYTNFYTPHDHASLARVIQSLNNPWVLTYDFQPEILALYPQSPQYSFNLNYSAATKRVGTELLITSDGIVTDGLSSIRALTRLAS